MNKDAEQKDLIRIDGLSKIYTGVGEKLTVFSDLNAGFKRGSKILIFGESGSGKSTLLNILGALDTPSAGTIYVGAYNLTSMDEQSAAEYRSNFLGLIFQFHYLLKDFTALENVFLPLYMRGTAKKEARLRAEQLLCDVGLEKRMNHLPAQLSGGERQRAAVARSLVGDPSLILADEPTGNLDPENARLVGQLLFSMVEKYDKTLIMATHDLSLRAGADECLHIKQGRLAYEL